MPKADLHKTSTSLERPSSTKLDLPKISVIITLPHLDLRKRSKKTLIIGDDIKTLIRHMEDATLNWEDSREHEVGVALAAIQIHSLTRVIIIRNNFEDKNDRSFQAYINPEITKREGVVEEDYEGCLSIKDVYGKVPRHSKVRVKALTPEGREVRVKAEGFLARVFQHEVDHTNGVMFIDHIKNNKKAFYQLTEDGKLEPLDYEKDIEQNSILW